MSISRKIGFLIGIIYVAGFIAPIHQFPWSTYYNEVPVGVALALAVAWRLSCDRTQTITLPRHFILLLLLPAIPILQYLLGLIVFSGDALVASLYLAGAVLAYYFGYTTAKPSTTHTQAFVHWIAWTFLAGALFSSLIALRQAFEMDLTFLEMSPPFKGRPIANLGQPNQLATLLLLGYVSLIFLYAEHRVMLGSFIVAALMLGAGLAAAQSRSSLLVVAVLSAWLIWKLPVSLPTQKKARFHSLITLALLVPAWFAWPFLVKLAQPDGEVITRTVSDVARLNIWGQMLEAIARSPLVGYGWEQVTAAQLAVADHRAINGLLRSAHNLFLDLMVWNGIPLGLLMTVAILCWAIRQVSKPQSVASWYALGVVGTVMTHSMLEFPLHYSYFLLPVAAMVGVVDSNLESREIGVRRDLVAMLAIAAFSIFLLVVLDYPNAEAGVREQARQVNGLETNDTLILGRAKKLRVLNQIKGFLEFAVAPAREGMTMTELDTMAKVAHRFAYSGALFRYVLALALNNRFDAAAQEMKVLRGIYGEHEYLNAKNQLFMLRDQYPQLQKMDP